MSLLQFKKLYLSKNVFACFDDDGGAKMLLSFLEQNKFCFSSLLTISVNIRPDYKSFNIDLTKYKKTLLQDQILASNVVLTGTSYPSKFELHVIKEAQRQNKISCSFVDNSSNFKLRFHRDNHWILPDKICVIDEIAKKNAVLAGIPEKKVIITGNFYHSRLANLDKKLISRNPKIQKYINNDKYFLYAPEPILSLSLSEKYGFDEIMGLKIILQAIKNTNITILISLHPLQRIQEIRAFTKNIKKINIVYDRSISYVDLAMGSSGVIGFYSNSLIEANALKKSIIRLIDFFPSKFTDPFGTTSFRREIRPQNIIELQNQLIMLLEE